MQSNAREVGQIESVKCMRPLPKWEKESSNRAVEKNVHKRVLCPN